MALPNYIILRCFVVLLLFTSNGYVQASANPFTILLEHAKKGNVDAMFEVGKYYEAGEYTDQNWEKSIYWYQKAIDNNHIRAMLYMGRILLNGVKGFKADVPRALELIEQAAEAGDAEAQFQLGKLFETGESMERDFPSAIRWYRAAKLQKYPGAEAAYNRSIHTFQNR